MLRRSSEQNRVKKCQNVCLIRFILCIQSPERRSLGSLHAVAREFSSQCNFVFQTEPMLKIPALNIIFFKPLVIFSSHSLVLLSLWAAHSGHDKLRADVGLDVVLPERFVVVQVDGAIAAQAAVAVASGGFALTQPVIGSTGLSPRPPTEPPLLQQQLQTLHLTARRPVLRVPGGLACRTEE